MRFKETSIDTRSSDFPLECFSTRPPVCRGRRRRGSKKARAAVSPVARLAEDNARSRDKKRRGYEVTKLAVDPPRVLCRRRSPSTVCSCRRIGRLLARDKITTGVDGRRVRDQYRALFSSSVVKKNVARFFRPELPMRPNVHD